METSSALSFRGKLDEVFPGSLLESQFVERAAKALKTAGFTGDNSIACTGICRDEICDPLVQEITSYFGSTFDMRGLAGFLSCGKTGFGAAHAHSPIDNNKQRYIYFVAPHIAIDEHGTIGNVRRPGIVNKSHACGALCALEAEVQTGHVNLKPDLMDMEQCMVKQAMVPRLEEKIGASGVTLKKAGLAELTKIAEDVIVRDQLQSYINATVESTKADYAIVAGIQVHGPDGRNYFCHVPEHCVSCVEGKIKPLVISTSMSSGNQRGNVTELDIDSLLIGSSVIDDPLLIDTHGYEDDTLIIDSPRDVVAYPVSDSSGLELESSASDSFGLYGGSRLRSTTKLQNKLRLASSSRAHVTPPTSDSSGLDYHLPRS